MKVVNKSQVSFTGTKLVGEASTMGILPGEWPDFIGVVDDKNEGFLFQKGIPDVNGRDVMGYHYYDRNMGAELLVIND